MWTAGLRLLLLLPVLRAYPRPSRGNPPIYRIRRLRASSSYDSTTNNDRPWKRTKPPLRSSFPSAKRALPRRGRNDDRRAPAVFQTLEPKESSEPRTPPHSSRARAGAHGNRGARPDGRVPCIAAVGMLVVSRPGSRRLVDGAFLSYARAYARTAVYVGHIGPERLR
jgi:hypothetical protein